MTEELRSCCEGCGVPETGLVVSRATEMTPQRAAELILSDVQSLLIEFACLLI